MITIPMLSSYPNSTISWLWSLQYLFYGLNTPLRIAKIVFRVISKPHSNRGSLHVNNMTLCSNRSLTAAWPQPDRSLTAAWQQPDRSLTAAWLQLDSNVTATQPQQCLYINNSDTMIRPLLHSYQWSNSVDSTMTSLKCNLTSLYSICGMTCLLFLIPE